MISTLRLFMPDAPVDRLELWDDLENMNVPSCPWMVGGDFNFILNENEKLGGLEFTEVEAMEFAQCINGCGLMEVKFSRSKYTWWNDKFNEGCIFERLDRVLINADFLNIFPVTEAHHLVRQGSDHTLV